MAFIGLGVRNSIPDLITVAFLGERLRKTGVIEELDRCEKHPRGQSLDVVAPSAWYLLDGEGQDVVTASLALL